MSQIIYSEKIVELNFKFGTEINEFNRDIIQIHNLGFKLKGEWELLINCGHICLTPKFNLTQPLSFVHSAGIIDDKGDMIILVANYFARTPNLRLKELLISLDYSVFLLYENDNTIVILCQK